MLLLRSKMLLLQQPTPPLTVSDSGRKIILKNIYSVKLNMMSLKKTQTLNVGHGSGKYTDLRLTDKYDFIMECNIDSLYKYDGFVGPEENDVRMTFSMKHSYSLKDLLTGYGMTDKYFMDSFEKFVLHPRPKYQKGKNVMLWLS